MYREDIKNHSFVYFDVDCDCGETLKHILKYNFFRRKIFACKKCGLELISRNIKLDEIIGKKYNKLTVIKAYREKRNNGSSEIKTDCVCDCGEIRKNVRWIKLKHGNVYSCKKCAKSISSMELFIYQTLQAHNINFIHQKKFADCRDIFELPYDFYLPDLNVLIEFDGSQHYETNHFGNSLEDLKIIQKHDKIKTLYANQHNIMLVRFNYKQNKDDIYNELLSIIGYESRKKLLA